MASRVEDLLDQLNRDQQHFLGELHDDLQILIRLAYKTGGGGGGKGGGMGGIDLSEFGGEAGEAAEGAGALAAGLAEVTAGIAVVVAAAVALVASLVAITYAALPFVQALSPATVDQFNMAMDGLKATIGEGLIPIITYATSALREWGGILLPAVRELKPVVEALSQAFSELLTAGVRQVTVGLTFLTRLLGPATIELAKIIEVIAQDIEAFTAMLSTFELVSDLADDLAEFRAELTKAIIGLGTLAAMLLKTAGATALLDKYRAALAKTIADRANPATGLMGAPKDATTGGIEDIAKKLNERSFIATAGGTASKSSDQLLQDLLTEVSKVAEGPSVKDSIIAAWRDMFPDTAGKIERVGKVVSSVNDESASTSSRFMAGRASGGLVGGLGASLIGKIGDQF